MITKIPLSAPVIHHYLMCRLTRKHRINIGRQSHDGHALFCSAELKGFNMWVVESRGPSGETGRPYRSKWPYLASNRRARGEAFREALADLMFRQSEDAVGLHRLRMMENARSAKAGLQGIG